MKVNSFFCGAGGFDLGFIQAGFEIAGAWDFDKYAVESYNHNIGGAVQADIRKLTPREYARLQGFPDSYEQIVSNSQFYKQMGNAVTVNVSHAIAKAIKEQLC